MFRFKKMALIDFSLGDMFQYILCFGSRMDALMKLYQLVTFQYILCFGSSMEPFSNFKPILWWFQYILCFGSREFFRYFYRNFKMFQYILCFGSSLSDNEKSAFNKSFNTSYVSVQV